MTLRKVTSLAAVLRRDPREFVERVAAIARGRVEPLRARRPEYRAVDWVGLVAELEAALPGFVAALEEPALAEIDAHVSTGIDALRASAPYPLGHNADRTVARCCYAAVRAVRPETVVETGVGYGVTTAFVLQALKQNGGGVLHSIDLPPLERGAEDFAGALAPRELRARWRLHRGMSRTVLPGVLAEVGAAGVFVHDSMHTYENMRFEFDQAWPRLVPGGVLISDDVQYNHAFGELRERSPSFWAVARQGEKPAQLGVAVR